MSGIVETEQVVEPEVLGWGPLPIPFWRRVLGRLAFGLILAVLGVGFIVLGAILTLTVVGAAVGIPLAITGSLLLIAAIFVPFMRGPVRFISLYRHMRVAQGKKPEVET